MVMKRHQVMDLWYGNLTNEVEGPWNNTEEGLPKKVFKGCKVKVKLSNGNETFAYFYEDKMISFSKFGIKPASFWECRSKEPLENVVQWKYLEDSDE